MVSTPSLQNALDGRYHILGEIGRGGMGVVFRVRDRLFDRVIALKRVSFDAAALNAHDQRLRHQLANEFRLLASLWHPSIITVLESVTAQLAARHDHGFLSIRHGRGKPSPIPNWHCVPVNKWGDAGKLPTSRIYWVLSPVIKAIWTLPLVISGGRYRSRKRFGRSSMTLDVLCGVALLKLLQGDLIQAAELLGLALAHPLASADVKNTAEPILDALRAHPSADTVIIEAARARGAALNVDTTVAAFLAETAAD